MTIIEEYEESYGKVKSAFCHLVKSLDQLQGLIEVSSLSPRQISSIKCTQDLLIHLEQRNVLNITNIDCLIDVANRLNINGLKYTLSLYKNRLENNDCYRHQWNIENLYAMKYNTRLSDEENRVASLKLEQPPENHHETEEQHEEYDLIRPVPRNNIASIPNAINADQFSNKSRQIYELIATDIGRNWRDLGRELGIRYGEMDEIEDSTPSIKNRVFKMLELFEQREDPRKLLVLLCEALDKARRKDLRHKVTEYLSR